LERNSGRGALLDYHHPIGLNWSIYLKAALGKHRT